MKENIKLYLEYCSLEKQLSKKTLKTYRCDLSAFTKYLEANQLTLDVCKMDKILLRDYVRYMRDVYKPTSVERKMISIKAFFSFLEFEEIIQESPFKKLRLNVKPPKLLPKTLAMNELKMILNSVYDNDDLKRDKTSRTYMEAVRNIAMIELFISTGIRINEMILLRNKDVDLKERTVLIHGKGNKERVIYISSDGTIKSIINYRDLLDEVDPENYLFVGRRGNLMRDDCIRAMLDKHTKGIDRKITPHVFRHAFATLMMDNGAHVAQIQRLLGHHSVKVTEVYTHVSMEQQRHVLQRFNPRNMLETPYLNYRVSLLKRIDQT